MPPADNKTPERDDEGLVYGIIKTGGNQTDGQIRTTESQFHLQNRCGSIFLFPWVVLQTYSPQLFTKESLDVVKG